MGHRIELFRKEGNAVQRKGDEFETNVQNVKCRTCDKIYSLKTSHSILKRHSLCHEKKKKILKKNLTKQDLDRLLINFIINGSHPFKIVEEESFKEFILGLNSTYILPTRYCVTKDIDELFKKKKSEIKTYFLGQVHKFSLTFDFWTSINNKPYIVITAHFVNNREELETTIIDFKLLPYPHGAEEIVNTVKNIIQEYGIGNKVIAITTDNEATNIKVLRLLNLFNLESKQIVHLRCLAHVLNLVVRKGLRQIKDIMTGITEFVRVFSSSPQKNQLLEECCDLLNYKRLRLIKETPTRWNSSFLMLERAVKLKEVINYICHKKSDYKEYAIDNWEQLESILEFLRVFHDATLILSKSKFPSICYVIPIIDVIKKHFNEHKEKSFLKQCIVAMEEKLNEYLPYLRNDFSEMAVILDPRLNNNYFVQSGNMEPLIKMKNYFYKYYSTIVEDKAQNEESDTLRKTSLFSKIYKPRVQGNNDIECYTGLQYEPEETEIIFWWKNNKNLPHLRNMAFDILAIPATSVPSEQAFSKSGNLITKKRNRLGKNTIRASMCLSSWLKLNTS